LVGCCEFHDISVAVERDLQVGVPAPAGLGILSTK
jgi:hypothetical protein